MTRGLSDRNRRWLTGELAHWQTAGIISPEQSQQSGDPNVTGRFKTSHREALQNRPVVFMPL